MSTSPINNLSSSYLQETLGTGLTTGTTSAGVSATSTQSDNQLSPFAQMLTAADTTTDTTGATSQNAAQEAQPPVSSYNPQAPVSAQTDSAPAGMQYVPFTNQGTSLVDTLQTYMDNWTQATQNMSPQAQQQQILMEGQNYPGIDPSGNPTLVSQTSPYIPGTNIAWDTLTQEQQVAYMDSVNSGMGAPTGDALQSLLQQYQGPNASWNESYAQAVAGNSTTVPLDQTQAGLAQNQTNTPALSYNSNFTGFVDANGNPTTGITTATPSTSGANALQQLQESNPTQYQQVKAQIATNQTAAQTATANGNTSAASQLNQLATDFNNASQNGQLSSISDLAQAVGGGGGHHHHQPDVSSSSSSSDTRSDPSSSSSSSTISTSSSDSVLSRLFASLQSKSAQNESLNPMSIVMNTLQRAGITPTNS